MRVHVFEAEAHSEEEPKPKPKPKPAQRKPRDADEAVGQASGGGSWHAFADVPYHQMWRDDIVWLPTLLSSASLAKGGERHRGGGGGDRSGGGGDGKRQICFEGHFLFDSSGPGPKAQLLNHNCLWQWCGC